MNRAVDDVIDIAVGVLLTAIMLFMGVWCCRYLSNLYNQPVIEKTAPTVATSALAPEHVYTGQDCLLELVINDVFCPEPNVVKFVYGTETQTITYDTEWFGDKEDHINALWDNFFKQAINSPRVTFELVYKADGKTPDYWLATMEVL